MENFTKFLAVAIIATLCFSACEISGDGPCADYIVYGKVIDKQTKEPVEGVRVSFFLHDKLPPPEYDGWSDSNGEFKAYSHYTINSMQSVNKNTVQIYFYCEGVEGNLYKDAMTWANFANVTLTSENHTNKNHKGYYSLNIGEIELEKID